MIQTINQSYRKEYLRKKNKVFLLKFFLWLFAATAGISGLIYFLFFSGVFYVKEVAVANKGFVANSEIRSAVDRYLSEKVFYVPRFNNILWVKTDEISALLAESFPALRRIDVYKKYPHTLEIIVDQKETAGIWCFKIQNQPVQLSPSGSYSGKCFYFDRQGVAFDTAADSSGAIFLNVEDETGRLEKLGRAVTTQDLLNFIFDAETELDKMKINIMKFVIPAGEFFQLNAQTAESWQIYFNTNDDLKKQLNSLSTFLANKVSAEKRSQLQYIDLRIPNRVYYR